MMGDYYAFCYLLSIYSFHYYYGILHRYPCNITISCLQRALTRDRTRGLLTASQKRYQLSYAGPRALSCLKMCINLMMCLAMLFDDNKFISHSKQSELLNQKKAQMIT